MFDYYRNSSSNPHHVCHKDSLTKGLYDHCQSDNLDIHSRSQVLLKLYYFFNLQYLGQYLSFYIQAWHDSTLMDAVYVYSRFDDLDHDARSQWVGKGKISALNALSN